MPGALALAVAAAVVVAAAAAVVVVVVLALVLVVAVVRFILVFSTDIIMAIIVLMASVQQHGIILQGLKWLWRASIKTRALIVGLLHNWRCS